MAGAAVADYAGRPGRRQGGSPDGAGGIDAPQVAAPPRPQMSSWIPHSRLRPKKRVSSSFIPGSQRVVVWKSPMET